MYYTQPLVLEVYVSMFQWLFISKYVFILEYNCYFFISYPSKLKVILYSYLILKKLDERITDS